MAKQQTVAPEVGFTAVTPKGEGVITEKNTGWFTVQIGDDEFKFRGKDLKCYAEEAKMGFAFVRTWIITTPLRLRPETGLMIVGTMWRLCCVVKTWMPFTR